MVFVACGLNHKTAPVEIRESVALLPAMLDTMLNKLVELPVINEAAILSTCNRTEIYCETSAPESVVPWLARHHKLSPEKLAPFFYIHHGHVGIKHTMRVASGLDSMMLGEPQIFGQLKNAYQQACRAGTIKKNLRHVFEYVFKASKRVRHLSGIGTNPVSIAYASVQLITDYFRELQALRVFIIGSGETATQVANYLHQEGVKQFFVASRTRENAMQLASKLDGTALNIGDIPQYLAKADVVITATACPLPFINQSLVEHSLSQRNNKPMFFLDLAVPRDIEPAVGELEHISLYNIDHLQTMTTKGMDKRRTAALQAEQLIDCELDNYIRWHRSLSANGIICNYRNQMQTLANHELERALSKLTTESEQNSKVLHDFCHRLVNKLIHQPTTGLRQAALEGRDDLLDLTNYLFNISASQSTYEEIT